MSIVPISWQREKIIIIVSMISHLTYTRVFAVRVTIQLIFETVVLDLGSCLA